MLMEWIIKEVIYLTITLREIDKVDDQKQMVELCTNILINEKSQIGKIDKRN